MTRKKFLILSLALAAALTTLAANSQVLAQSTGGYPDIVQKIAQKFGLQESEVQAVFDEAHQEHRTAMRSRLEERLTQAVTDGKITEAQKQAILEKFGEMSKMRFENKEQMRTEMETWLGQNGLTHELLHDLLGHPGKMGRGFGMRVPAPAQ